MVGGGNDNYYDGDKEKVVVETVDDEIADDVPKGRDSYEVAPAKLNIYEDKVPMVSCVVQLFQKQQSGKPYVVLLDSGSSCSWWNGKSLPKGCVPKVGSAINSSTLAGKMTSRREETAMK